MCGIAGIYNFGGKKFALDSPVNLMCDEEQRRGPDDRGLFLNEEGVALGHTRLSILDLTAAGHQPMHYECQVSGVPIEVQDARGASRCQVSVTFNGEIYNFLELRKELEAKGHQFKTKTDTEVILVAYAEWGVESFKKLRGMFAFALWDAINKRLYLVKDRYGVKPLYYFCDEEKIVFASTVKAIKESGLVPIVKNEQASIGFLLFGSVPLPHTTIKDVFGLMAGHYLEIDASGGKKLVKYYEPLECFANSAYVNKSQSHSKTNNPITNDLMTPAKRIRALLEESVRLHMISDAPLGVFLSGGTDSSALAILAAKLRREPITTLSVTFDEAEFSEKKYQDLVAGQIKSDHREYKVTKQDFENSLADIFEAMDQPTVDGINTYFVAEAAKKAGLKAVLSGLGADELFMGYQSFRNAEGLRRLQLFAAKGFWSRGLSLGRYFGDRWQKLSYLQNKDILSFYLVFRGLFDPHEVAKILNISIQEVNEFLDSIFTGYQLLIPDLEKLHPADLLSYLELKFYLQNQLLKDSDFMAMHHSIEIRVPFLDHFLVEYLSSVSADIKLSGAHQKQLLIDAISDLPGVIYNRPKMGFTFPFQKWLADSRFALNDSSLAKSHWSRVWAREVIKKF